MTGLPSQSAPSQANSGQATHGRAADWQATLSPQLSCLIVGETSEYTADARSRLQRSSRVGAVEVLADEVALAHELASRPYDLIVLILGAPDSALPKCLLRHPDTKVLVVAPNGVKGTLTRWLQQGADDLVSPEDGDAYDHALSRLLDACALSATMRRQAVTIDVQRQRIETLVTRSPLIPIKTASASTRRRTGRRLNLLRTPGKPRIDVKRPRVEANRPSAINELPGRKQTLSRLIALAARPHIEAGRGNDADTSFIALQLTWPLSQDDETDKAERTGHLERIVTDLAIYRAADALRNLAPQRLLLGRTRINRLVLLSPIRLQPNPQNRDEANEYPGQVGTSPAGANARDTSREVNRARQHLGTLGGLLGSAEELEIDAITGSLESLASSRMLAALDAMFRARTRTARQDQCTAANDTMVPMVTNRVEPEMPQLEAAQS